MKVLFALALEAVMAVAGRSLGPGPNGLARTPPMGWMSWQAFRCQTDCTSHPDDCVNERLYMQMADAMSEGGYLEAGYNQVSIDDCWEDLKGRNSDGELVADPDRFPSGMKVLGDYMHSKNIDFGTYSDAGTRTCGGFPGSKGYEEIDAKTFASWGVDYLKLDGCYNDETGFVHDYPAMGAALQASGRNITYSCSWPAYLGGDESTKPFDAMIDAGCNLWRNWIDIQCDWGVTDRIIEHWGQYGEVMVATAGPGHWHDPDMLLIGAGCLTSEEERTQMAIWSIVAAPLVMGNDLRNVSQSSKSILLNKDAIAVDQDTLGKMGKRLDSQASPKQNWTQDFLGRDVSSATSTEIWSRELSGGDVAVALYNRDGGSPSGIAVVAESKACATTKAMGGDTGFGYSLLTCRDAVVADKDCISGYFDYSASYNGQCKCALDSCDARVSAGPYVIYKLDSGAGPMGPDISISFRDLGLQGPVSIYDIWAQTELGVFQESYTAQNVSFHDTKFLRLSKSALSVIAV